MARVHTVAKRQLIRKTEKLKKEKAQQTAEAVLQDIATSTSRDCNFSWCDILECFIRHTPSIYENKDTFNEINEHLDEHITNTNTKTNNTLTNMPHDVLIMIGSFVPINGIDAFQSVCTNFYDVLNSDEFLRRYYAKLSVHIYNKTISKIGRSNKDAIQKLGRLMMYTKHVSVCVKDILRERLPAPEWSIITRAVFKQLYEYLDKVQGWKLISSIRVTDQSVYLANVNVLWSKLLQARKSLEKIHFDFLHFEPTPELIETWNGQFSPFSNYEPIKQLELESFYYRSAAPAPIIVPTIINTKHLILSHCVIRTRDIPQSTLNYLQLHHSNIEDDDNDETNDNNTAESPKSQIQGISIRGPKYRIDFALANIRRGQIFTLNVGQSLKTLIIHGLSYLGKKRSKTLTELFTCGDGMPHLKNLHLFLEGNWKNPKFYKRINQSVLALIGDNIDNIAAKFDVATFDIELKCGIGDGVTYYKRLQHQSSPVEETEDFSLPLNKSTIQVIHNEVLAMCRKKKKDLTPLKHDSRVKFEEQIAKSFNIV